MSVFLPLKSPQINVSKAVQGGKEGGTAMAITREKEKEQEGEGNKEEEQAAEELLYAQTDNSMLMSFEEKLLISAEHKEEANGTDDISIQNISKKRKTASDSDSEEETTQLLTAEAAFLTGPVAAQTPQKSPASRPADSSPPAAADDDDGDVIDLSVAIKKKTPAATKIPTTKKKTKTK